MALNNRTPNPLSYNFRYVNPDGTFTPEFLRQWQAQEFTNADSTAGSSEALVKATEALDYATLIGSRNIIAGIGLDGGGTLGAGNVTINMSNTAVTPGIYGDATNVAQITIDQQGRITLATNVPISGGGGGGVEWTLTETWEHAVDGNTGSVQASVAGKTDVQITVNNVTKTVVGLTVVQVSTDNGVSWYTTSGNYQTVGSAGTPTNGVGLEVHTSTSTASRSGVVSMSGIDVTGTQKWSLGTSGTQRFSASTAPITDVRVIPVGGGDFTGGSIYIQTR